MMIFDMLQFRSAPSCALHQEILMVKPAAAVATLFIRTKILSLKTQSFHQFTVESVM